MKVWVTRDQIDFEWSCGTHETKKAPEINSVGAYPTSRLDLTTQQFKKRYGFVPDKGSCKQMNLTLTKIKT